MQKGVIAGYKYDPFEKRILKSINGTNLFFVYSGDDVITEYDSSIVKVKYVMNPQKADDPVIQKGII